MYCDQCASVNQDDNPTMYGFIDKDHELCCINTFCSKQCLINYLLNKLYSDPAETFLNNSSNSDLKVCQTCSFSTIERNMYYYIEKGHELCCHLIFCSKQCVINYLLAHLNTQLEHDIEYHMEKMMIH